MTPWLPQVAAFEGELMRHGVTGARAPSKRTSIGIRTAMTRTPPLLTVTALPAQEAYDYEYHRARLADPSVLDQSVAIRIFRAPLLAIAEGGPRRGGSFSADHLSIGLAVHDLLKARPGFTDLRLRSSPYRDACYMVEWGDVPPMQGEATRDRFYGYSDTVRSPIAHRPSPAPCSPEIPSSAWTFRSPASCEPAEEGPYPHQ